MNTAQFTPAGTMTAEDLGRIHLIGVGGVGMSGLARLLPHPGPAGLRQRAAGVAVAGRPAGARRHHPHAPTRRPTSTAWTRSSTPRRSRRTIWRWSRRAGAGLRVLHRSEALAAAMTGRRTVAVAGTHGKTTTTSMVTMVLQQAGIDPSFVIGGEISEVGSGAHHGTGEYFVVEADESDRSFLIYRPVRVDHHEHRGGPPQHLRRPGHAGGGVRRVRPAHRPGRLRHHLRRRPGRPAAGRDAAGRGAPGLDVRRGRRRRPADERDGLVRAAGCATWPRSRAGRSARSGCRYRGGTWGSTAPPRCSPRTCWSCRSRRRRPRSARSPACGGASSARASPTACWSTTSTPTTRPR